MQVRNSGPGWGSRILLHLAICLPGTQLIYKAPDFFFERGKRGYATFPVFGRARTVPAEVWQR